MNQGRMSRREVKSALGLRRRKTLIKQQIKQEKIVPAVFNRLWNENINREEKLRIMRD